MTVMLKKNRYNWKRRADFIPHIKFGMSLTLKCCTGGKYPLPPVLPLRECKNAERKIGFSAGFTFIEVMISLSIVAIVLVTLLHTHLLSMNLVTETEDITLMTMLLQSQMSQAFSEGFYVDSTTGTGQGVFSRFVWARKISKTSLESLRKIDIEVHYADDERASTPVGQLSVYICNPELKKIAP